MASDITREPVGQILPGPAPIPGAIDSADPQYSNILGQMRQHGDLSTIGGTACNCDDPNHVHSTLIPQQAALGSLNDGNYSSQGTTATPVAVETTTTSYAPQATTTMAPSAAAPVTGGQGFGHSDDFKGFQQSTDSGHHPHGNAAQELLAHHGGLEKDAFGRRKSSSTPVFHEPSDGRRTSTSGYEQYHPSSFTRTDDLGYTTNPLGGSDVKETSTGGAKLVGGRGYLVTGDTGAEGYTSAPLGDFNETGPGGGEKTEGRSLKDRIAGLVERADERKAGTTLHSQGL